MPIALKVALNVFFYILYVFIAWILFSFLFPIALKFLWKPLLNPNDPVFNKIWIIIAILVLIISVIFRKYFYISIDNQKKNRIIRFDYNPKKQEKTKTQEVHLYTKNKNNDDLEIIIWKE